MSKITVIGSLNMDLVITTSRIPVLGETILGRGFMKTPGGKGANQAVASARLGGQVSFIGCVGQDIFGEELIENLNANKVNVKNVFRIEGDSTGVAVIIVKDGNNMIIVDSGANFRLTPRMIDSLEEVIKESTIVVLQLEIPIETVETAAAIAKRHNVKTILNPAPARLLSDKLLKNADIITPNETEAEILTGIKVSDDESARQALIFLRDKGIEQVIITLGSKGALYNRKNEIILKPVPKVKVVDTTAAGDAFTGAIAVSLSKGCSIDEAIDFANMAGTLTVTRRGAQLSLPELREVMAVVQNQKQY